MNYTTFAQTVTSFVVRNKETFNAPNTNYVLTAMNNVRRAAQRDYTFNLNRTPAFVEVSMIGQSLLTDFYSTPAVATTPLVVKQVDRLYEYDTTTVSSTTVYRRLSNVRFHQIGQLTLELPDSTRYQTQFVTNSTTTGVRTGFCYLQGVKLYHTNLTSPTWIMADVVEFLPDHTGGTDEDIFLTYFSDWLQWATIMQLNQYLSEDSKINVDIAMVDRLWESVKQFDAHQAFSTDSINLD